MTGSDWLITQPGFPQSENCLDTRKTRAAESVNNVTAAGQRLWISPAPDTTWHDNVGGDTDLSTCMCAAPVGGEWVQAAKMFPLNWFNSKSKRCPSDCYDTCKQRRWGAVMIHVIRQ